MAAETASHGGEQSVLIICLSARGEALVERGGENGRRNALINRRIDRPAALAGIRNPPGKLRECGILYQSGRCEGSSSQKSITLPCRHTSAGSRSGAVSASISPYLDAR